MSNSKANQSEIVLGVSAMEITREPTGSNTAELIAREQIVIATPVKIADKPVGDASWNYRHEKIVQVDVLLTDGNHFIFDLQEVTGQAGWTADLAGQQQCIADINAWL